MPMWLWPGCWRCNDSSMIPLARRLSGGTQNFPQRPDRRRFHSWPVAPRGVAGCWPLSSRAAWPSATSRRQRWKCCWLMAAASPPKREIFGQAQAKPSRPPRQRRSPGCVRWWRGGPAVRIADASCTCSAARPATSCSTKGDRLARTSPIISGTISTRFCRASSTRAEKSVKASSKCTCKPVTVGCSAVS